MDGKILEDLPLYLVLITLLTVKNKEEFVTAIEFEETEKDLIIKSYSNDGALVEKSFSISSYIRVLFIFYG